MNLEAYFGLGIAFLGTIVALVSALATRSKAVSAAGDAATKLIQPLNERIDTLQTKLKEAKEDRESLRKELKETREALEEANQELVAVHAEMAQVRVNLQAEAAARKAVERKWASSEKKVANLLGRVRELEKENTELRKA